MASKVFGIRGVDEKLKDQFYTIGEKEALTPAETLAALIERYKTPVNSVDTESLRNDNAGLQADNERLQSVNTALTDANQALTDQLQTAEATINALQEQLSKKITLTGDQFILTPSADMAKQMRRAITYEIKAGNAKRDNPGLVQWFTERALKFLIKNEYSHILK